MRKSAFDGGNKNGTKGADASERDANLAKYSAWVNTLA